MIRRRSAATLIAVLALTACSSPTAPTATDPRAALTASTSGLSIGNYRYTLDVPGVRVEGTTNFASRSAAWTTTYLDPGRTEIEMRQIGQDQYTRTRYDATSAADKKKDLRKTAAATDDPHVKADIATQIHEIETGDKRYRHLDLSRIPQRAATTGLTVTDPDRTGATKLLPWVHDATTDGKTIHGTLSIPRPLSGEGLTLTSERLVDTLTFTAGLDQQGRLSRLEIDLPATKHPAEPAGRWTLIIDGYGTTPPPERPAPIKEAPKDLYDTLGS